MKTAAQLRRDKRAFRFGLGRGRFGNSGSQLEVHGFCILPWQIIVGKLKLG